jgi:short-subunit dehydrogenase
MKTAIVTGASKGLGAQIVRRLRRAGFHVVGFSRTSPNRVDVRDSSQVNRLVSEVLAERRGIDVLINNAGFVQSLTPLERTSDEDLLDTFETNVYGPFYTMRSVIPSMVRRNKGVIINIASKSAIYPVPKLAAYSASKSALVTLTQAVAKELRKTKVVCLAVCPAGMRGAMRATVYGNENAKEQQSTGRVANIVYEIVMNGTASRRPVSQGSCTVIRKDRVEIREMQDE